MAAGRAPTPFSLAAYRAVVGLASPLAAPLLRARARRGKEDSARLTERLGQASAPRRPGPLVWMHAVSVGESLSLLPLIAALRIERPDLGVLVTSGTIASAEILARRLPDGAVHQYAPIDTPAAVKSFLGHWRPDVGIFVESELWPNLVLAARDGGARLALISARMTEKSARRWATRPAAARTMLACFDLILAQDAASEQRLSRLGGEVAGRLNLKLLGAPLPFDPAELAALQAALGGRQVVLAASTHASEEAPIVAAIGSLTPRPLSIIAPRHPERTAEIVRDLASHRVAVRSAGDALGADTDVYLADTLGELGLLLGVADVAVMAGSFLRGIGGHNPLEAGRLGVGVITGPDIANHADAFLEMAEAGGAMIVPDQTRLAAALAGLLSDPARLAGFNRAALDYAGRQGDQLAAGLDLIRPLLPAV